SFHLLHLGKGFRHVVSALRKCSRESSPWPVLVVLLHAGDSRPVSVHQQVRPPRRERLQRQGAAAALPDPRPARLASEGRHPGTAGPPRPRLVAPRRRPDGQGEPPARRCLACPSPRPPFKPRHLPGFLFWIRVHLSPAAGITLLPRKTARPRLLQTPSAE